MAIKKITTLVATAIIIFSFSGCATYYATSPIKHEIPQIQKKVPIKIKLTQTGSSIVINQKDEKIKQHLSDLMLNSIIFTENNESSQILQIGIQHSNDNSGLELTGAFITGLSLYLIPSVADSNVDITISSNEIKSTYKGELVVAQGMAHNSLIDKNKYTENEPLKVMKDLLKNALDQFTSIYLKNHNQ